MIKVLVSDWLGKRKMTQIELAKKAEIRPATVNALYHERAKRIELDQLERICLALDCEPGDILKIEKEEELP